MTLTELSYYSRKFTPFGIIGVLLILIFYYTIIIVINLPKDPVNKGNPINPVFGKLKAPIIQNATNSAGITFNLDTIEGKPIDGPPVADVFFLTPSNTRVGYRIGSENMAKVLGFDLETAKREVVAPNITFIDDKQKLSINITTFNFNYQYEIRPEDEFFKTAQIPSATEITNKSIDFLRKMGRYPEELAKGKTNIIYLFYNTETKELSVTKTPEEANMVEVDFYRPDIETYPFFSPKYFNSQNYALIVFHDNGYKVIRAQVQFFEKSTEQVGKYPLKNGQKALEDLNNGKGIMVSRPEGATSLTIKEMLIGYLDPEQYQEYLQPVYVFLGEQDENFVGFVPAVDDSQMQD